MTNDKNCDIDSVSLLTRREIEGKVIAAVIEEFTQELGRAAAYDVCKRAIAKVARADGREAAKKIGANDIASLKRAVDKWSAGGSLDIAPVSDTEDELAFNVTRCAYADLYRSLGIGDLGKIISCNRDYGFIEGFNPGIELTREQVIMDGAPICDFCYRVKKKAADEG